VFYAVGGSLVGLYLSYQAHLASGPCMVATLGLGFLVSSVLSPRHGLLRRFRPPPAHHQEQTEERCELPGNPPHAH